MALNKVKKGSQMYDWITATWNTIKGECPHLCSYCYMNRYGKQKPVRFDEKELKTDLENGHFIFVGSSCDMFAEYMKHQWIIKTLNHCKKFDNTYLFQTKNPKSIYHHFVDYNSLPENIVLCTTIETNRFYKPIMKNSPNPFERSKYMNWLSKYFRIYLTIEPIIDFDLKELLQLAENCNPIQVNIGANTSNIKLPEPPKEKILKLISELEKFTIVKQKKNLNRLLK